MAYIDSDGNALTLDELEQIPPRHEIRPGLWQGCHPSEAGDYDGFDMVVSCESYARRRPLSTFQGLFIHVPFPDSEDETEVPWGSIETAGEAVAHALSSGHKVYVHCTAGLNRSSLVVHQALRGLGASPQGAIDTIRKQRSKWCLCNKTFERLCLEN